MGNKNGKEMDDPLRYLPKDKPPTDKQLFAFENVYTQSGMTQVFGHIWDCTLI